ncbi:hypothetical protein WJX73_000799 [Symbiochloris irregularis]|uniref:Large ribosomal subunit protein mL54 n=1 Tax=Symbiochloris irregularis TaxID=706552 RepID=A0AAW1PM98_9CHLO
MALLALPLRRTAAVSQICRGMCAGSSTETATGINILKAGSDPPLRPDSEYPEWVSRLAEPPITYAQLQRQLEGQKEREITFQQGKRWLKLDNRQRIKDHNTHGGTV